MCTGRPRCQHSTACKTTLQLGLFNNGAHIIATHEAVAAGRHACAAEEVAAGRPHSIEEQARAPAAMSGSMLCCVPLDTMRCGQSYRLQA